MTNEELKRMEELEKQAKELEELKAANAAKAQGEGSGDDGDKKPDAGKKPGFFTKIKEGASKAINHKFSIKDVVIAAGVVTAGVFGIRYAYEKGVADGRSESEFEGTATLPDSGEQLSLGTTTEPEVFETQFSDDAITEEVYESEE